MRLLMKIINIRCFIMSISFVSLIILLIKHASISIETQPSPKFDKVNNVKVNVSFNGDEALQRLVPTNRPSISLYDNQPVTFYGNQPITFYGNQSITSPSPPSPPLPKAPKAPPASPASSPPPPSSSSSPSASLSSSPSASSSPASSPLVKAPKAKPRRKKTFLSSLEVTSYLYNLTIPTKATPNFDTCLNLIKNYDIYSCIPTWGARPCDKLPKQLHDQYKSLNCDTILINIMYNVIQKEEQVSMINVFDHVTYIRQTELSEKKSEVLNIAVVVARFNEDINWLSRLPINFQLHIFSKAGGQQDIPQAVVSRKGLFFSYHLPYNYGDEATVYLEYILKHYDNASFPSYVAFVHGHETSWHIKGQSMASILMTFNYGAYSYMDLNYNFLNCFAIEEQKTYISNPCYYVGFIESVLHKYVKSFGNLTEHTICNHCCSQFVVSRERILAQPKQLYQDSLDFFHTWHSYEKRINPMERTFHLLFGEPPLVTKLQKYTK